MVTPYEMGADDDAGVQFTPPPKVPGRKAILLLSGGIDSTVAMAMYLSWGWRLTALTFDYGQTLRAEVVVARANARRYDVPFVGVRLDTSPFAAGCALLDRTVSMPLDRTLDVINAATPPSYVPFRNGIFLAYAIAMGEAHGIEYILCGGNGLHSGQYPDDTSRFAGLMQVAANEGTSPTYHPAIEFPNALVPKRDIVAFGLHLGVDFAATLSCYQPLAAPSVEGTTMVHCGRCDSCVQRRHAFEPFGLPLDGHPRV